MIPLADNSQAPSTTTTIMRSRSGSSLERVSDAVDQVNLLKSKLNKTERVVVADASTQEESSWNTLSTFDSQKDKTQFRQYVDATDTVKAFYAEQHTKQTVAFNIDVRVKHRIRPKIKMSVWEAIEKLNTLIDESDPDTHLSQIEHLLQTAEAIRRDGKPEWMQVVGLTHDLGKLLFFLGSQGQWDVVGDTFVVGCKFDERIIYHDTFVANPDFNDPTFSTVNGVYTPGCGLDNVMLSYGHDEYLYQVFREQSTLPEEGLAMIRYHSFYPWHREGAYTHLMEPRDYKYLEAVRAFNPYDLYSKADAPMPVEQLKPYYMELIEKFFPSVLEW
ncbi:uncharacterized protein EI90DRAFT_2215995 [Cantharellus anzutake]|uniref:uncharacterized protein n=1 Tax=Cantharellus anzutake TaxID=1750568 RepID=UPI001905EDA7|nr:uncharacterized protein EI90DRAFT_2215995 [Cantharellus anzutake]KAF8324869.1 hypothetical protein EI90DRAFT_2215995 [Cantharellus anzutake]